MTATATRSPATDKQIGFIHHLNSQAGGQHRATRVSHLQAKLPQRIRSKRIDDLTKTEASEVIDRLQDKV